MEGLRQAQEAILNARDIAIAGHINPDGDSIGSLLSLGLGLEKLGKRVYMISWDGVPERYKSLPAAGRILKEIDKKCDLAIAVDCSSREILGRAFGIFEKSKKILEIDHHDFRRPFGNIQLVNNRAAAVGELIYILLNNLKVNITKDIAQNLLTSIIVETDSFRMPDVEPFAFRVCADLAKKGVNFYKLVDMVFWSKTKESIILSGICLSRCRFLKNNRIVWSIVRKKDFDTVGGRDEDVDAVADEMRSIRDVQIVVLFREKDKRHLRVSLRSKGKINIASVAEVYNGGGHFDVAGCRIPNSSKSIKRLLDLAVDLLGK